MAASCRGLSVSDCNTYLPWIKFQWKTNMLLEIVRRVLMLPPQPCKQSECSQTWRCWWKVWIKHISSIKEPLVCSSLNSHWKSGSANLVACQLLAELRVSHACKTGSHIPPSLSLQSICLSFLKHSVCRAVIARTLPAACQRACLQHVVIACQMAMGKWSPSDTAHPATIQPCHYAWMAWHYVKVKPALAHVFAWVLCQVNWKQRSTFIIYKVSQVSTMLRLSAEPDCHRT